MSGKATAYNSETCYVFDRDGSGCRRQRCGDEMYDASVYLGTWKTHTHTHTHTHLFDIDYIWLHFTLFDHETRLAYWHDQQLLSAYAAWHGHIASTWQWKIPGTNIMRWGLGR